MALLGKGNYEYLVVENWAHLPETYALKETAGVATDANDNVYVFNRGDHPMMVFNKEGEFIKSWGEGVFPRAHGITMSPDGNVFCTDDGDHTVRKCTLDGDILFTLGISGTPSEFMSGNPFNRCTHVAFDPKTADFYVSDGYGNARIHKYSADGELMFSWGEPGNDPGQFNIAHNVCTDKEGWVYVADRENHRVQIFDSNGKFETQWVNMARPCGLYIDSENDLVYIGELGPAIGPNHDALNLGPRVSIYKTNGELIERLGNKPEGEAPGQFIAPHGICVDSERSIYVGEVSWTHTGSHLNPPREIRSLQKLVINKS